MTPDTTQGLSLTCTAELPIVATANYLRYGPEGVRRFHPGAPDPPAPHPRHLATQITLKAPDGAVRLHRADLTLHIPPDTDFDLEGATTWQGDFPAARLHILLVWDFYRLYSLLRLSVAALPQDASAAHRDAWEALRAAQVGDTLILEPPLQVFPIDQPALPSETPQGPLTTHS